MPIKSVFFFVNRLIPNRIFERLNIKFNPIYIDNDKLKHIKFVMEFQLLFRKNEMHFNHMS